MNIAVACGLIILVLLVIMLLAGVPIAVALAVSSICAILPVLDTGAAVLTGAQRIFSGRGLGDITSYWFLSSGTSGYEAHSGS